MLIHRVYFGETITAPEDSGIQGPADGLPRPFKEELMEQKRYAQN
jgi:hypothetical protein